MIKRTSQILSFVFFIIINIAYSQSENKHLLKSKKEQRIPPCKIAIRRAKKDAKKEIYIFITHGLTIHQDLNFHKFYVKYMSSKYRISIIEGSCVFGRAEECYTNEMKKIIYKEFGENILKKGREEAEILYKNKTTLTKKNRKHIKLDK